jgi:hypothetical protein
MEKSTTVCNEYFSALKILDWKSLYGIFGTYFSVTSDIYYIILNPANIEVFMKLPSVHQMLQDASRTFLRFPLILLDAALGTVVAVILIDFEGPSEPTILFKILLAAILGIPLLTGFTLYAEKRKWKRGRAAGLQLIGVLLLAAYAFTVPSDLAEAPAVHILRLLFIAVALHLFVAFAPFMQKGEWNGFWHYNKSLLLRLILSLAYTLVLYAGLSLALAALDNLFGINVQPKRYAELWMIIIGLFNTWLFLAGIPANLDELETSTDYPKSVKIFAQYILYPLVLVYLVILYAYLAKILISWEWPQGWVGRLILGFATAGIFSILLLYPVRDRAENIWIGRASRWFYVVMIPLVIMLFLALWRRISEYGITESRYLGVVLDFWLGGIVLYFILSKIKSIKVIPISLCVLALITSFGPWGVFSMSENSQVTRLRDLLTRNNILENGRIRTANTTVPQEDTRQISSIIGYLHDFHGYDGIQTWFPESLMKDSSGARLTCKAPGDVAKLMGIEYVQVWTGPSGNNFRLTADQGGMIDVRGYDGLIRNRNINESVASRSFSGQELQYRVSSGLDTITFLVTRVNGQPDSVQLDLQPMIGRLLKEYPDISVNDLPPEKLTLSADGTGLKLKIYFRYLWLRRENERIKPSSYGVDILYGMGRP